MASAWLGRCDVVTHGHVALPYRPPHVFPEHVRVTATLTTVMWTSVTANDMNPCFKTDIWIIYGNEITGNAQCIHNELATETLYTQVLLLCNDRHCALTVKALEFHLLSHNRRQLLLSSRWIAYRHSNVTGITWYYMKHEEITIEKAEKQITNRTVCDYN